MEKVEDPRPDVYGTVLYSFALGMLRFWRAEAASARLNVALLQFRARGPVQIEGNPYAESLSNLAKIPYSSYDALAYVTDVSHLLYATTLLDTFLTDTTLFLFLNFPQSMGKNQQVPLAMLLAHGSRHAVLTEAATRRAREIGYLSFAARVQFLRDAFGLRIPLTEDVKHALDHYPSVRNAAVHDQGAFELTLDERGHVVSRQKACFLHPSTVGGSDVREAIEAYSSVALSVATSVMAEVLNAPAHPALALLRAKGQPDVAGQPAGEA